MRIVATLATVMLILGSWIHVLPMAAHDGDGTVWLGTNCVDDLARSATQDHRADGRGGMPAGCCDSSSCNAAIIAFAVRLIDRTENGDAFLYNRQPPLKHAGDPPFKPPRLG